MHAQVVLFYLQHAPGGFSAPKALLSAGVVRGLAVAFPKFGPLQSAEELRCVLLLCAAGSAEVREVGDLCPVYCCFMLCAAESAEVRELE